VLGMLVNHLVVVRSSASWIESAFGYQHTRLTQHAHAIRRAIGPRPPGCDPDVILTLGENSADNAGLRIAYRALMDTIAQSGTGAGYANGEKDGYTPSQRFFIAFGQVWCQNQTEPSARQSALTDPHSPGRWRTNGSVQNFDEFGKAFGCTKGQPMYPANSCRVW